MSTTRKNAMIIQGFPEICGYILVEVSFWILWNMMCVSEGFYFAWYILINKYQHRKLSYNLVITEINSNRDVIFIFILDMCYFDFECWSLIIFLQNRNIQDFCLFVDFFNFVFFSAKIPKSRIFIWIHRSQDYFISWISIEHCCK